MIPENGVFVFISHATLSTTPLTIPSGTTHIVVATGVTGTLLQDESGILGFKESAAGANKILAISCGEFIRLFSNIPAGVAQFFKTTTVGGIAPNIDQVSFYKWEQL